jgi:hypothetical protein
MYRPGHVVPFSFDLSSLVQRSVASLYSHLVTRPTGRALRMGIESQIGEIGSACLSVLDFTQVVVLDYSCADEAVAKLIQRYQAADRPADAYFVARGLGEQHRHPIEEVLVRHRLTLVAELAGEFVLLGSTTELERAAWHALQQLRAGAARDVAARLRAAPAGDGSAAWLTDNGAIGSALPAAVRVPADGEVAAALDSLAERRVVLRSGLPFSYLSLTMLLQERPA